MKYVEFSFYLNTENSCSQSFSCLYTQQNLYQSKLKYYVK